MRLGSPVRPFWSSVFRPPYGLGWKQTQLSFPWFWSGHLCPCYASFPPTAPRGAQRQMLGGDHWPKRRPCEAQSQSFRGGGGGMVTEPARSCKEMLTSMHRSLPSVPPHLCNGRKLALPARALEGVIWVHTTSTTLRTWDKCSWDNGGAVIPATMACIIITRCCLSH